MTALQDGGQEAAIAAVLHDVLKDSPEWPFERVAGEGFSQAILAALDSLTRRTDEDYLTFVQRCAKNPIARVVKLADLKDNMDLSRIPNPSAGDATGLERYHAAKAALDPSP